MSNCFVIAAAGLVHQCYCCCRSHASVLLLVTFTCATAAAGHVHQCCCCCCRSCAPVLLLLQVTCISAAAAAAVGHMYLCYCCCRSRAPVLLLLQVTCTCATAAAGHMYQCCLLHPSPSNPPATLGGGGARVSRQGGTRTQAFTRPWTRVFGATPEGSDV